MNAACLTRDNPITGSDEAFGQSLEFAHRTIKDPRSSKRQAVSMNERCPKCGNIRYGFNAREPDAGLYWLRRKSDGKMCIAECVDDRGRKHWRFDAGTGIALGLSSARSSWDVIEKIVPPVV
jgi:hypothetical protein